MYVCCVGVHCVRCQKNGVVGGGYINELLVCSCVYVDMQCSVFSVCARAHACMHVRVPPVHMQV